MLGTVGLLDDCTFRFSQWDPANPKNKYEGTKEQWDYAQEVMGKILDHLGLEYTVGIDEAAFYGPKLSIYGFHLTHIVKPPNCLLSLLFCFAIFLRCFFLAIASLSRVR